MIVTVIVTVATKILLDFEVFVAAGKRHLLILKPLVMITHIFHSIYFLWVKMYTIKYWLMIPSIAVHKRSTSVCKTVVQRNSPSDKISLRKSHDIWDSDGMFLSFEISLKKKGHKSSS
jgi:hypothetical protein